jgi:ADP-ribosylglycohydrolase
MATTLRSSRIVAKVGLAVAAGALLAGACCLYRTASQEIPPDEWAERVRAGWVGKLAAGSGALPTEMWDKGQIRRKYGELSTPPQTPTPRGPLDDTTLAFLGWQAAREHGPGFTSADIAANWVEHLPDAELQGGGFGREFLDVLKRLRQGEAPPVKTGTARAEWIAAQMRAEIWGMLAPGDAARAADYAERDASIFNTGNGVYAAQFVAVMASRLMVDPDLSSAIQAPRW